MVFVFDSAVGKDSFFNAVKFQKVFVLVISAANSEEHRQIAEALTRFMDGDATSAIKERTAQMKEAAAAQEKRARDEWQALVRQARQAEEEAARNDFPAKADANML